MKKDYPDIQALENEKWQDPDPATGKLGTRVPAKWLQLVEDSSKSLTLEILEVLKEAKIEPNELKNTQLKDAIIAIAAARIINWKDVQNAPKILDLLGDSKIDGASQRIVNVVNTLAKNAMTAANLANDKANQANTSAEKAQMEADKKRSKIVRFLSRKDHLDNFWDPDLAGEYAPASASFLSIELGYPISAIGVFRVDVHSAITTIQTYTTPYNLFIRLASQDQSKNTQWVDLSEKTLVTSQLGDSLYLAGSQQLITKVNNLAIEANTQAHTATLLAESKSKKNEALLSQSGWHKCGETGLVTQWGTGTTNNMESITINFPIAFPSTCRGVELTSWTSDKDINRFPILTSRPERTAFTAKVNNTSNTTFYWQAIGY